MPRDPIAATRAPSRSGGDIPAPEELAELLDLVHDGVFVRQFRDRRITYWNQGAEELYGWKSAQAVGRVPGDLLKTVYPIPLEEIEWILGAVGRWEGELEHTHRSGRKLRVMSRWILRRDAGGEPLEIYEVNTDVTLRRAAEANLRMSEERFQMLVQHVRDYAIFMLDPKGIISSWNEGARRIKGWEEAEIVGRHFSTFYPPEDKAADKPGWELEQAQALGAWEDEGWRLRKDGSRFWANVVITALFDDSGRLVGYAKVTRDLTRRREEEERLRLHAERMAKLEAAKSNFLNLASHELRGPLTVIRGYLSMIADGSLGELSAAGKEVVPILRAKVEEMASLIEQMLEVARLEEGRLELAVSDTDVTELVRQEARDAQRRAADAPASIVLQLPEDPVTAQVDQARVRTILANLMSNALKYSPAGGNVTVRLHADPTWIDVTVEDQGIGIGPADVERLFTRFGRIVTSETSSIPGVGLGLYLSRELARMHGGDISVSSQPGQGSTFKVRLARNPLAG